MAAIASTGAPGSLEAMSRRRVEETRLREAAEAHFERVWRFLWTLGVPKASLDDAAQEVFLVAANKFADIRPGSERAYLFSTAVHIAHKFRRKHAREQLVDDPDEPAFEPASTFTPENSFDEKQEHELLMQLIDGLPDDLRTVFMLFEIEDESIPNIAAMLGIPEGTATSRLRRAREKFEIRRQRLQMRMRGET